MVDSSEELYDICDGDMLRFQIVNGTLWVFHISGQAGGWYPAVLGPGNVAAKGRVPYALLLLMQTLRAFPGQIPDVDAVWQTGDFTCIRRGVDMGMERKGPGGGPRTLKQGRLIEDVESAADETRGAHTLLGAAQETSSLDFSARHSGRQNSQSSSKRKPKAAPLPLPMFSYTTSADVYDLPLPDYTYLGHEYHYLVAPGGTPAQGWDAQALLLATKYGNVALRDRLPQAVWRGRLRDKVYPHRDRLRRTLVDCARELEVSGRPEDAALMELDAGRPLSLQEFPDFRYQLHIEPQAWVSNLRHKLAGGSVVLTLGLTYFEWFSRALVSGEHFMDLEESSAARCERVVAAVRAMNRAIAAAGPELPGGGEITPTLKAAAKARGRLQRRMMIGPGGGQREGLEEDRYYRKGEREHAADEEASSHEKYGAEKAGNSSGDPAPAPLALRSLQQRTLDPAADDAAALAALPRKVQEGLSKPWTIANKGREFVQSKVTVVQALLYTRDMLRAYAARQRFAPSPHPKAVCYDGERLLQQFAVPYSQDRQSVERAYPWLVSHGGNCPQKTE